MREGSGAAPHDAGRLGNRIRSRASVVERGRGCAALVRRLHAPTALSAAVAFCAFGLLTACHHSGPAADLVILNGAEPESLDPAVMTGQADLRAGGALFEGLTRYNPTNGLPEPGLAARWEISPDGRTYLFHLRPEARWSTGDPITAEDFAWSWLRILAPETGCEYAGILFYVKNGEPFHLRQIRDPAGVGIRALDRSRFQVALELPTAFFLDLCALPTLAAVPRRFIETHGDRWLTAVPLPVSGAYQLETWRINDRIRLRQNPHYWDAANIGCALVDLLPCTNPNTALNLYETGAADIVWDKNLVPSELLDLLLTRPDFHAYPVLSTYFLRYNVTRKPFADPRIRRAFGMVIDRQRLVRRVTRGGERPSSAITPPLMEGYTPPSGLEFDPPAARRLLAEAGFADGKGFPPIQYLFDTTTKLQEQIAVELQEMWRRELGIAVGLRKLEWKTYLVAQRELDYDVCRSSWIGDYSDPNTFLDLFLSNNGNNRTGWKNARYDQLLRQANAELDPARRGALLHQTERLLVAEEAPIVPLFHYTGLEYYDPRRIHGVFPNARSEHPLRAIRRSP